MVGLGLIGLFWEWKPIGITVFLSSAFSWVLMPFIFAAVAGANTDLTRHGVDALRSFLTPLLVVSFVQSVWAFVEYWRHGPTLRLKARQAGQLVVNIQREKEKRVAKRYLITPLSPCWKLPVVDKLMCEHCPVRQRKRSCWRLKMGCQCSPAIIDALLSEMAAKTGETGWLLSSTSAPMAERATPSLPPLQHFSAPSTGQIRLARTCRFLRATSFACSRVGAIPSPIHRSRSVAQSTLDANCFLATSVP